MVKEIQTRQAKSNKISMTCKRVTSLIMDYLSEELINESTLIFEEHLNDCPNCAAFVSTYKRTIRAAQSLPCENIPTDMENRVRKFLREKINELPRVH